MNKKQVKRIFNFRDMELADPNTNFSVKEVRRHYSVEYPELTTADIEGPKHKGGRDEYIFKTSVGTKG